MIKVKSTSSKQRARNYSINESAGDVVITKAVVLAPSYIPRHAIDFIKVLSYDVHAVYNSFVWNRLTSQLSKGILKSHADIIDSNEIDEKKIIGYFVKEGNKILEYELDLEAHQYLSDDQVTKIENELQRLKW